MDLRKLQKNLKKNDWIAADKETKELLCNITERSSEGFLVPEVIAQIPYDVLRKIDLLWSVYSNDAFGFSVQCSLWLELGGEARIYMRDHIATEDKIALGKTETQFAHHVGWKVIQARGKLPDSPSKFQTIGRGSLPFLCLKCDYGRGSVGYILSAIAWRLSFEGS
jgi:hypothetical protein